ncbi:odorant receptor 13a-like [Vespula squamosa]|uniref:Odorant receptor 13a-like n=1 Tax=Vespula squamosa TaxID=30214 RepID=A0ABD2C8T8_VESSQ
MREWGNSTGENRERNNGKNKGRETKEDRGIQIPDIQGNKRRRDPEIFRGQEKGVGQEDNSKIQDKKWNEDEATLDETGRGVGYTEKQTKRWNIYTTFYIMKFNFDLLADILEDTFNIVICLHMVVSTISLCTSTYQMLLSFARLEKVYISTFLIYFCLPLCTLCGYCYTDECLIEEVINRILIQLQFNLIQSFIDTILFLFFFRSLSVIRSTNLCDANYHWDWYELSTIN